MWTGPLRLGGVPEHFNLPWHLALESGPLGPDDATWEDQYGGTGEMLAKLEAGELDVASILTEGTVKAINGGMPLTIIQVYVSSPLQWGVFVPGGSDLQSEAELAGARIAISRFNSGSHLMSFIHAESNGWTIDDDQFVVVGDLAGAIASFGEGASDLFLWEQHMCRPLVDDGTFRQLGVLKTPWPSFVIVARDEVLTGRTTEVGHVVDAVIEQAVTLHDRQDNVRLIAERYGLENHTVESWLSTTRFVERSPMDQTVAETVLDTLGRAGF